MSPGLLGRASAIFAVTNVDDLLIVALFFSRTTNRPGVTSVVIGQYVGFTAILVFSIIGALGAGNLADSVILYLGLLPLLIGIGAVWNAWRQQRFGDHGDHGEELEHETSTGARISRVAGCDVREPWRPSASRCRCLPQPAPPAWRATRGCSWSASRCGARPDGSSPPDP
jgi:hypothetical protein